MDRFFARQSWLPASFLAASLYFHLQAFALPAVPFLLRGDQTFFWFYALRILHGEWPYRDFFQFTPPGTDLFYAMVFKLFGARVWTMNAVVILVGVAITWLCFELAAKLMSQRMAMLAAALILVLIYGARLDATHHWFSLFAVLLAVRILVSKRTASRVAIAG